MSRPFLGFWGPQRGLVAGLIAGLVAGARWGGSLRPLLGSPLPNGLHLRPMLLRSLLLRFALCPALLRALALVRLRLLTLLLRLGAPCVARLHRRRLRRGVGRGGLGIWHSLG